MLTGIATSTGQLIRLRARAQGIKLPVHLSALFIGDTRSAVPGRGMDYEESRKYTLGDDSRMIDWRVTARTGTAHTKVFREDRQRTVHLAVDLSSSMRFGTQSAFKSVVAAEAASLLAWAALDQGNLVSTTGISDSGLHGTRAASVPRTLTRQLAMLADLSVATGDAAGFDGLGEAWSVISRKVRAGDMVVAISDFNELSESAIRSLESLSARRMLTLILVLDRIEREGLPSGYYRITDSTRFSALALSSKRRCETLRSVLNERIERIQETATRLGVPIIELHPGDDVAGVLAGAFRGGIRARDHLRQSQPSEPVTRGDQGKTPESMSHTGNQVPVHAH